MVLPPRARITRSGSSFANGMAQFFLRRCVGALVTCRPKRFGCASLVVSRIPTSKRERIYLRKQRHPTATSRFGTDADPGNRIIARRTAGPNSCLATSLTIMICENEAAIVAGGYKVNPNEVFLEWDSNGRLGRDRNT